MLFGSSIAVSLLTFLPFSFGGFASKYIKGRFFMDVHPPLAKLLITLAGWLAGFDGEFDFKDIGKDYLEPQVPYVAMRMLPAIMGVMTIPTMFLTLKAVGCRTTTAALGAGLVIFGERHSSYELETAADAVYRERPCHSVATYPIRFPLSDLHRVDCPCLDILHEPARTRTFEGLQTILVVLACRNRCLPWSYSQCKMGGTLHDCMGWQSDGVATMGAAWGL